MSLAPSLARGWAKHNTVNNRLKITVGYTHARAGGEEATAYGVAATGSYARCGSVYHLAQ